MDKVVKNILVAIDRGELENAERLLNTNAHDLSEHEHQALSAALAFKSGNIADAESLLRLSSSNPKSGWLPPYLLCKLYLSQGRGRQACDYAQAAFNRSGYRYDCFVLLLHSLLDQAESPRIYELFSKLPPTFQDREEVLMAMISVCRNLSKFDEAHAFVKRLRAKFPTNTTVNRLEADLVGSYDSKTATKLYRKAICEEISSKGKAQKATLWNSALHFLRARNFRRGWQGWAHGFDPEIGTLGRTLPEQVRHYKRADTAGRLNPNNWTFVVPEQGVGDQILFLSKLDNLIQEAQKIILCADPRLKIILERSFPDVIVAQPGLLEYYESSNIPSNGIFPYGSILPRYVSKVEHLRVTGPFLRNDVNRTKAYRQEFLRKAQGKTVVGISWKGGFWNSQKSNKSLSLDFFTPLINDKSFFCVNLQYGLSKDELVCLSKQFPTLYTPDRIDYTNDLDNWLSLICATDINISVSTALVHFSGGSGHPTIILMPEDQGPWILGNHDVSHKVYPRTSIIRSLNAVTSFADFHDLIRKEVGKLI